MPAFDPVRDAALNSPVSRSNSLPAHAHDADLDRHERHSFEIPSPSSSRPSSARATNSPTVGRRATDLAVLLNSEPQEPRTPGSARPSSLSHLLLGTDTQPSLVPMTVSNGDVDKLADATSLRRRGTLPVLDIPRTDTSPVDGQSFQFSRHPQPSHPQLQVESSVPRSRPSPSSISTTAPVFPSPSTMPPPPSPLSSIPYGPRDRKTLAGPVLLPMLPQEIEFYRHYRGIGTQLLSRRKRERSRSPDNSPPAKRHAGDVGKVIDHC